VLPLKVCTHSIKIGLEADSYYVARYTYNLSDSLSSVKLYAESTPFNIRIATELELQLDYFPILPVVAPLAIVAVASIGLLVYLKKRRR